MVDVVVIADAVLKMHIVVDGSKNVFLRDMLRDKLVSPSPDHELRILLVLRLVEDLLKDRIIDQLRDAVEVLLLFRELHPAVDVHHHGGKHLDIAVKTFDGNENIRNSRVLDLIRELAGHLRARFRDDLAGRHVNDVLREDMVPDAVPEHQLLIEFVAADLREVIPSRVEEHPVDEALRRIDSQRFARADLLVEFKKAVLVGVGGVLGEGRAKLRLVAEHLDDLLVRADAHRADQLRDRDLSGAVHTGIEDIVGVRLIFEPCAAVRDNRAGVQLLAELVVRDAVVDARRADKLADDDTLCAVDDERAGRGHQRQVAHEDLMLFDFAVLLVEEPDGNLKRSGIVRVAFLALLDRVFHFIPAKFVIDKFQAELIAEIFDWRDVIEYLAKSLIDEPLVGCLLHLDEIRHFKNFLTPLVAHSNRSAGLYRTNSVFLHSTFHPVIFHIYMSNDKQPPERFFNILLHNSAFSRLSYFFQVVKHIFY